MDWLARPLSLDELEAALGQCNNSSLGLDGLRFFLFKEFSMGRLPWPSGLRSQALPLCHECPRFESRKTRKIFHRIFRALECTSTTLSTRCSIWGLLSSLSI
jgi:hypothetical protein